MIIPINGHLLIQPIEHESFISSQNTSYQEIGTVLAVADGVANIPVGGKVYFDSWLAAKYPAEKDGEFYWLVEAKNIRALSNA